MISLPYQDAIGPDNDQRDYITFLLVGDGASAVVDAIRSRFDADGFFWLDQHPGIQPERERFYPVPPADAGLGTGVHEDRSGRGRARLAPPGFPPTTGRFCTFATPAIPTLESARNALLAVLSLVILFALAPVRRVSPDGQMFFLGAGFMLLETKGVVHMALVFGRPGWSIPSSSFHSYMILLAISTCWPCGRVGFGPTIRCSLSPSSEQSDSDG